MHALLAVDSQSSVKPRSFITSCPGLLIFSKKESCCSTIGRRAVHNLHVVLGVSGRRPGWAKSFHGHDVSMSRQCSQ
jgi:hypothetical protein